MTKMWVFGSVFFFFFAIIVEVFLFIYLFISMTDVFLQRNMCLF